jgi:two-component system sensor histidine kinase KdpD
VVIGSAVGIGSALLLSALMLPFRSHVSIATFGLVLVVPVVAGVITGGYLAGLVSVAAGFLVYNLFFIPPYGTLSVGAGQNWVALGVYAVVMVLVAQVVGHAQVLRQAAQRRAEESKRLFELSELLVEDSSVDVMLKTIVDTTRTVFGVPGVALLLPEEGRLVVAAQSGERLSPEELSRLYRGTGQPVAVGAGPGPSVAAPTGQRRSGTLRAVALTASGRPIGILALSGPPESDVDRALLHTFANHAALALERATLREQALRSETLEEIDRVRDSLLGAVSHDLRTPLATMKVASSTLLDSAAALDAEDTRELYGLIDAQTERLSRLVASLLDLTRYESGALKLERTACSLLDVAGEALAALRPSLGDRPVELCLPEDLPAVEADPVLVVQVLINLIDNADRHAPPGTPVTVAAWAPPERQHVVVSVADQGPGVPRSERQAVFERFIRFDSGGRAGLGLSIARSFVEAHGGRIWVEEAPGGGACFAFTLSRAGG